VHGPQLPSLPAPRASPLRPPCVVRRQRLDVIRLRRCGRGCCTGRRTAAGRRPAGECLEWLCRGRSCSCSEAKRWQAKHLSEASNLQNCRQTPWQLQRTGQIESAGCACTCSTCNDIRQLVAIHITCCLQQREEVGGAPIYENSLQQPTAMIKASIKLLDIFPVQTPNMETSQHDSKSQKISAKVFRVSFGRDSLPACSWSRAQ
jgi:hypothetical protein